MAQDLDTMTLTPTAQIGAKQVTIQVAAELMKNQQKASPIEANQNLAVVEDSNGKPLLFSIGTDQRFYAIRFDPTAESGWKATDLLAGFQGYTAAAAFAVSQDLNGNISVLVALSKAGAPATDLFLAGMLPQATDWTTFGSLAHKVTGVDSRFAAEKMLMGTSDDGNAPIIVVTGAIAGEEYYYQVDGSAGTAARFEFPQDVIQQKGAMQDLSIGYAFGQRGLFFLYKIGAGQTLTCTTLPTPDEGSEHYDYSPGNAKLPPALQHLTYNCIATPTGSQTDPYTICSDIYVGTDQGIYLFRDAHVSSLQKVTDELKDVHEIMVTQDGQNISVWAMVSPNRLYYIYGQKGDTYTWHSPVLFSQSAIHIAPLRSQVRLANELFIVDQQQTVTQYWQDPATTLWQQRLIQVPDGSDVVEFNSYTTHIHLQDELGRPLVNQTVNLTASEWTYAEVNGLIYSLDKETPAAVQTDVMGNVTVIGMADDISAPIFYLDADFLDKTLNIYPNGKVHKGLAAITKGADLTAARTTDGQPVLTQSFDSATLDGVAANLTQLTGTAGQSMNLPAGSVFVAVTAKGSKATGAVATDHLPANFAVGMQVKSGSWQPLPANSPVLAKSSAGNAVDDVIGFAGDLLKDIENTFEQGIQAVKDGVTYLKDGVSFVIKKAEQGLMLVLNMADKVLNVVLDSLGAVVKAVDWLLNQIGIALEKILAWLGNLFGWTEILETSDKIVDVVNNWLGGLIKGAPALAAKVDEAITSLEKQVADPSIVAAFGDTGSDTASGGDQSNFQSPALNWIFYHILHGSFFAGGQTELDASVVSQITGTVTPLLSKEVFSSESSVQQLLQALVDGLSSMSIGDLFKKVLEIIAVMALETVKGVSDAIFELATVLVQGLTSLINYEVKVPLLSKLLELFLEGRKLTMLRVWAIAMAIGTRILHLVTQGSSLNNDDLTLPSTFNLADMIGASVSPKPASLKAVSLKAESSAQSMPTGETLAAASAAADEKPVHIPAGIVLLYEVARFTGMIFSDANLAAYLEGDKGDAATKFATVGEIICTVVALGMVGANWLIVKEDGQPTASSWAQIVVLCLSGLVFLLKAVGLKADWKAWARGLSLGVYCLAIVFQGVGFSTTTHNRSNDLQFTSNFFLSLWNGISAVPFKVENPYVVLGFVIANSLAALTHIAVVFARYITDEEDNVTFMLA